MICKVWRLWVYLVENEDAMKWGSEIVKMPGINFIISNNFFCNKTCDLFKIT